MALNITYKISNFALVEKCKELGSFCVCGALIEFHSDPSHISIIDAFKSRRKHNKRIKNIFGLLFSSQFLGPSFPVVLVLAAKICWIWDMGK